MYEALAQAQLAAQEGEVPVGCVVVRNGQIIVREHNRREQLQDPTAHAELLAVRRAAAVVGSWRLSGVTVYVTLEPCSMCAGSLVQARVERMVFGASDPKAGAVTSLMTLLSDARLNHQVEFLGGVLVQESGQLLRAFFAERR